MKADSQRWLCLIWFSLLWWNLLLIGTLGPETERILSIWPSLFSTASHLFATNWDFTPVWRKQLVYHKLNLNLHLHILDYDCTKKPGGIVTDARIVMPDPKVAQVAQRLGRCHHKALNTGTV